MNKQEKKPNHSKTAFPLKSLINGYTISAFLCFSFFLLLIIAAFGISYRRIADELQNNMQNINGIYIDEMESALQDAQSQLKLLTSSDLVINFVENSDLQEDERTRTIVKWQSDAVCKAFNVVEDIAYFTRDGSMLSYKPSENITQWQITRILNWMQFNGMPKDNSLFITLPENLQFTPYFIEAVYKDGVNIGFLSATISKSYFYNFLGRTTFGEGTSFYVCDKNLNLICGSLSQKQWRELLMDNHFYANELLPQKGETVSFHSVKSPKGKQRQAVCTLGKQFGIVLISTVNRNVLIGQTFSSFWPLFLTTLLMFLVAVFVNVLIYRRLDAPLEKMVKRCTNIQLGQNDVLFEHCGDNSLNVLADTLNETMRSISAYQANLEAMAFTDTLLGIGNRSACIKDIEHFIETEKKDFSIFMIDVVDFEHFNELFSVKTGDMLLRKTAAMLDSVSQSNVYRYNGDTFVIVILEADGAKCANVLKDIKDFFNNPVDIPVGRYSISMNAARADYPDHGVTATELLRKCKTALKYCKSLAERNICITYNTIIASAISRRNLIKDVIIKAVNEKDDIEVLYQPIYSVQEGHFTRLEALLRIKNTQFTISPAEAIAVAEENGLMSDLGEVIITSVCSIAKKLQDRGCGINQVSINLSLVQLLQHGFFERLKFILMESQVPLSFFQFEITENVLITSFDSVYERVNQLKALGVRFALDDFGAVNSGISYLANLPVDTLKLDRSIVLKLGDSKRHDEIVKSIISACRDFSIDIVAEGVENSDVLEKTLELGVDYIQGFFYANPMPSSRLFNFLEESKVLADMAQK
ncbi:MAG: EAL domain-containing protein [Treponemataceae bacterium]|nr:EAL domain-containing protein [Treponemataceae bacterium]